MGYKLQKHIAESHRGMKVSQNKSIALHFYLIFFIL